MRAWEGGGGGIRLLPPRKQEDNARCIVGFSCSVSCGATDLHVVYLVFLLHNTYLLDLFLCESTRNPFHFVDFSRIFYCKGIIRRHAIKSLTSLWVSAVFIAKQNLSHFKAVEFE